MSRTLNQVDQALLELEAFVGDPEIYQGYGSTLQEALIRYSDLLYYDINFFVPNTLVVGYFGQVEPEFKLPFERLNVIPRTDFAGGAASITLMRNPESYFEGVRNLIPQNVTTNDLVLLTDVLQGNLFDNTHADFAALLLIESPVNEALYYTTSEDLYYRYNEQQETFTIESQRLYFVTDAPVPTWVKLNGLLGRLSIVFQTGFTSLQDIEDTYPNGVNDPFVFIMFVEPTSVFFVQELNPDGLESEEQEPVEQTFNVTVVYDEELYYNVYVIDDNNKPVLELVRGGVYTFDQSDATNDNHPIAFRDGFGISYTEGVVSTGTPGEEGAQTVFTVPNNAPSSLRYYCTVHGNNMGNVIQVTGTTVIDPNNPLTIYGNGYAYDTAINEWEKIAHTYPVIRVSDGNVQVTHNQLLWQKDYLYKLYFLGESGVGDSFVIYAHDLSQFEAELGKLTTWLGDFPDPSIVSADYFTGVGSRFGIQEDVNYGTTEPGIEDVDFIRDQIILGPNATGDATQSLLAEGLRSKSFLWSKHFRDNGIEGTGIVTIDNATLNLSTITNVLLPNFGSYAALPSWMLINKNTYESETDNRINVRFNEKFVADIFTPEQYETTTGTELANGTIYLQLEVTE